MRFIESLCPPAFLYLGFLTISIALDLGGFNILTAGSKVIFGGITVYFLQLLCRLNLGVVAWFIVALPFVVTSIATAVALGNRLDQRIMGGEILGDFQNGNLVSIYY